MNERIEQLLKQATEDSMGVKVVNQAKFAELLIGECAKVAYRYASSSDNYDHYDDIGWDCLPGDLQSHIKQHFGVK